MANSLTLSELQTRAGVLLGDTGASIYTAAIIEAAARVALDEYSAALPRMQAASITGTAGREINVSTVSPVSVTDIWAPYSSSVTTPQRVKFEFWPDLGIAALIGGAALVSTDAARVFYTTGHTLNGLDSASATSFPQIDNSLILCGTVGHALNSRAIDLTEQATIQPDAVKQITALAADYLSRFKAGINLRRAKEIIE